MPRKPAVSNQRPVAELIDHPHLGRVQMAKFDAFGSVHLPTVFDQGEQIRQSGIGRGMADPKPNPSSGIGVTQDTDERRLVAWFEHSLGGLFCFASVGYFSATQCGVTLSKAKRIVSCWPRPSPKQREVMPKRSL
jgi:hypothetical protein